MNYFIFPTLSLIIATLIGGEIVKRLYSPNVNVKAKNISHLRDNGGFFISLNIVNLGRTVANDCICYLMINSFIDKEDIMEEHEACTDEHLPTYRDEKLDFTTPRQQLTTPAKFRKPEQVQLCWAHHGNPCVMNINPGVTKLLDICRAQYIENNQWYIIFPSEKGWRRILIRMRYKNINGKIFICPSNDYPKILDFSFIFENNEPTLKIYDKYLNKIRRRKILKE